MSSRDFTHELHRTTKTIGYSKVIETLQSMARIQPSGANEIPTTVRQNRTERDSHNTLGIFGLEFFNLNPQIDEHTAYDDGKTYLRRPTTLPAPLSTGSTRPSYFTREGISGAYHTFNLQYLYQIQGSAIAADTGRNNLTIANVFELNTYDIADQATSNNIVSSIPIVMQKHSDYRFRFYGSGPAGSGVISHYHDIENNAKYHIVITTEFDQAGVVEAAFYVDGARTQIGDDPRVLINQYVNGNLTIPPFLRLHGLGNEMALSHASQFTHFDAANFDMDAWIAKDRAGTRDFTDPNITEWFTWRGYSLNLERDELPGAYG